MSAIHSRLTGLRVAVSGLCASLAAPLVVRAAPFEEVFKNINQPTGDLTAQQAITELFNNRVYAWGLYAVSVAAIFGIFYGGFLYITAQGNTEQATKGKNSVLFAVLAVLVLGIMLTIMIASRNVGEGVANSTITDRL